MASGKDEIKNILLDTIAVIGEKSDDGFVYFRKEKLLNRWGTFGIGRFRDKGFGKLPSFLKRELPVDELSSDEYRIPQSSLGRFGFNERQCSGRSKLSVCQKHVESKAKVDEFKHDQDIKDSLHGVTLSELKVKVFTMIDKLIDGKPTKEKDQSIIVTLKALKKEWRKTNLAYEFTEYGHGTFKNFLIEKCLLKLLEKDRFEILPDFIKAELQTVENENENVAHSSTIVAAESFASMKDSSQLNVSKILPTQDDEESVANVLPDQTSDSSASCQPQIENSSEEKSPDLGLSRMSANPTKILPTQDNERTIANVLPDQTLEFRASSRPQMENSSQETIQGSELSKVSAVKQIPDVVLPETRLPQSKRYYTQLVSVLIECGLKALRNLFMKIHPNWSNKPNDMVNFDKGTTTLQGKKEIASFKAGDISQWDISLMSKVLLHSKVSKEKLSNDTSFTGCKAAIETITLLRNSIQGHNSSGELTKHDYETKLEKLRNAVVDKLGFDAGEFDKAVEDSNLCKDNEFYQAHYQKILSIEQLLKDALDRKIPQEEITEQAKSQLPDWDEWIKVSGKLGNFDNRNSQYMLIVDRFDEFNPDYVKILEGVLWKLVIDLDPDSDNSGVFSHFDPKESQGGLVETITPTKIIKNHAECFVDANKMPWVFANGRNMVHSAADERNLETVDHYDFNDKPKNSLREWKLHFKTPIVEVVRTISEKLDPMKPNFCIILGIKSGLSSKIATILLEEIQGRFGFNNFTMRYVAAASELDVEGLDQSNFTTSNLSLSSFMFGVATQVGIYGKEDFQVPGKHAGAFISLKKHYNYLSEHLEIMYKGCEDIPQNCSKEEARSFEVEHLKSFISGNPISFASLHFRHDATGSLTSEVNVYISRLSADISKPQIIQITHHPGSGGTTIARRVLWDLHKIHPCAIVKVNFSLESFSQDSDGDKFIVNICERINCLEENCKTSPVILIDGKSVLVRILSDYIARHLKGTAIILRCINFHEVKSDNEETDKIYRLYFNREFVVNANLQAPDNRSDYSELKSKYEHYQKEFQLTKKTSKRSMERVFHFPLMAMLGEFEKLKSIVNESLDRVVQETVLKGSRDYEVAVVVAFLQLYADRGTPAILISKYILKKTCTYDELTDLFSVALMNLLIPEEAPKQNQFLARKSLHENTQSDVIQQYTFQHRKIAEQVLEHCKRKVDVITQEFLSYKFLNSYRKEKEITDVVNSLFLHNKSDDYAHFLRLVMELGNFPCGGRILEDAAKQSKDVSFYSHIARFFAYRKHEFEKARQLIEEGFKVDRNVPADKKKRVQDTLGHIVFKEIMKADIPSVADLKVSAKEALDLFRQAREYPPRMFPNPLIGEVMVWLFCLEYIIKTYEWRVDQAIEFVLEDEFFCDSIADCISLLDEVDEMVAACKMLPNPRQTEELAYEKRCRLRDLIARSKSPTPRGGWQDTAIFRICNSIAQYENRISRKALLKLQVRWLMIQVENNLALLNEQNKKKICEWLFKLVDEYGMFDYARYLMDVASLHEKPPFAMEKALRITSLWQEKRPFDPYGYFYQYILCFLKICNNEISFYKASYKASLDSCEKRVQGRLDQHRPKFYVGKDGEHGGICNLVSHAELVTIAEKYNQKHKVRGRKEDEIDQSFWDEHCQNHLLVCRGRIQYRAKKKFDRPRTFISMEPGLVEISVARNIVGNPYRDFQPDAKVSFIVALTLAGPKAKEVWIDESRTKGKLEGKQFIRQGSKNLQKQE